MFTSSKARRTALALVAATLAVAGGLIDIGARGDDTVPLANRLVGAFDTLFKGPYPGARAIHAKGILVKGSFVPDAGAAALSAAPHLRGGEPVPVLVRFSDFSGIPSQPDGKPGTTPLGMAIKFLLQDGIDTDIVAHSYDGFPAATPEEFLAFVKMLAAGDPAGKEAFLAAHAAARQFLDTPKPVPVSYGTESFYGVNAFRFTNAAAVSHFGRYRINPLAGERHLTAAESATLGEDYLHDEFAERVQTGPVRFRLAVQLAGPSDSVVNGATPWPASRPEVTLGVISLTALVNRDTPLSKEVFFSPLNLVPGIASSGDPMLAARTASYAISYRRRSEAE